ncbi:DUF5690 family protein [Sphingomonas yunnanensis]|uniref:DUF5690 family protein n=1 Tax=Sphingomonas yunnanensis TaxID=310400 RepID=UPI001CA7B15E|nr:DUF5690 family protein [Sphingomonas yunnanensis]MBY9063636.1 DUF5690 family protein [Sphingomonas yunnanensis]
MDSLSRSNIPSVTHRGYAATALYGLAAFGAYFAMYAFRKPFAAATLTDVRGWHHALDYKSALLIAQVVGYAVSKLVGIRIIAEFGRVGRGAAILLLIAAAWVALVGFALTPAPWNIAFLFLNGLPLGLIWGLVFSYVEGRRTSELIGAILCASFIVSSGVVKSVGTLVLDAGVSAAWMPALTGLLFAPLLVGCVAVLERMPPPDTRDVAERRARLPMSRTARSAFLRAHGTALALLIAGYVLLTALRDVRDNFAAELWQALGARGDAAIFSQSELPVAAVALAGLAALIAVRDNRRAVLAMHAIILGGALLLGVATVAFQLGWLSPLGWMILGGAGLYLAYTPYNAMLFDRMVAAVGQAANAGFLIYVADSSGYAGSVALLVYRSVAAPTVAWLRFFVAASYATAIAVAVMTALSALHFRRTTRTEAMPCTT